MAKLSSPIFLTSLLLLLAISIQHPNLVLSDTDPLDCDADDDLTGVAPVTNTTVCYAPDQQALLSFKAAITQDPNQALQSWSANRSDCCSWNGVTCDGVTGRVVSLDLAQSNLQGALSPSIGSLTALQLLKLYENSFTGPLPPSLGNLSNLTKLCLSSSTSTSGGFSGSIPESVGGLTSVQIIDVSYNSLSGPLPSSIGNLSSLQHIRIYNNKISGPIPDSFGLLSNLYNADLAFNQLSGQIPDSFNRAGGLVSLAFLFLESNNITGLPGDLSNLGRLQWVDLDSNPLGSLENVAGLLTAPQLAQVELANCGLSGADLGAWLAGGFPRANTGLLSDEVTPSLNLADNGLTGSIPANIGSLLPGYIEGLSLANNGFSAGIPASLANLTSLRSLALERNELTGSIPAAFTHLSSLVSFNVSYNRLSGEIPQAQPFTTFDVSSYQGNAGLCGTPLPACNT